MNVWITIALGAAIAVTAMSIVWLIATRTGRTGWIDVLWTFATAVTGAWLAIAPIAGMGSVFERQLLVAAMAYAWALRLGLHIARRTLKTPDDPRYAKMRGEWGAAWPAKLYRFLMIQAGAAFLLSLSIMAAARNSASMLGWFDLAGLAILVASIIGAGVADRQLERFAANSANRGKVCNTGLWSWSRHPNYFFEWLGWTAYAVIALNPAGAGIWSLAGLIAPALMYWALVYQSGIPPLEEHMLRTRGEAFRAYQRRVNAFFPAPPKQGS